MANEQEDRIVITRYSCIVRGARQISVRDGNIFCIFFWKKYRLQEPEDLVDEK